MKFPYKDQIRLLRYLALVMTVLTMTSCFFSVQQKPLIIPLRTEVTSIDPHQSYDYVSNFVTYQIYETLFCYHFLKRPYTHEPLLAEDFPEVLDGGKTLRIKIKKGILYHHHPLLAPGRTVKAQDFVWSFKRYAYKYSKSRAWWLSKNIFVSLDDINKNVENIKDLMKAPLKGVVAKDDYTLELHLTKAYPLHQILNLLTMSFTSPIPEEVFTLMNNDLTKTEVGTGAYYLETLDLKNSITLQAFTPYETVRYPNSGDRYAHELNFMLDANKKIPFIPRVEFKIIPSEKDRWDQFFDKKFSLIELPREYFNQVINFDGSLNKKISKNNWTLEQSSSLAFWFMEFNTKDPVMGANIWIRKAISYALNIDLFLQKFNNNADQKANSLYVPGIFGYSAARELPYKYDLAQAKEMLQKAGYDGKKKKLVLNFDTRRDTEIYIAQAEFIKQQLAAIGIEVHVRINNFAQFIEKAGKHEMQFWQGGWMMDFPDAENILQLFYSGNAVAGGPNKSQFSNPKFDELYNKILQLPNGDEKLKKLEEIENIIHDELPVIMFYYSRNFFIYDKEIHNFRFNELSMGFLKYLRWQN